MTFSCSIRLCSVLCALSLLLAGCGDNEQPTMPTPPAQEGNQYDIIFVSSDFGQPSRLYRMSETGDSLREIPFPIFIYAWLTFPDVSPDGRTLLFTVQGGSLYTMDIDGRNPVRLGNGAAGRWSPDGSAIAFEMSDGDAEIGVMNSDGTGVRQLSFNTTYDNHPTWSPDGTQLLFTSMRSASRNIFTMNSDGSDVQHLIAEDYLLYQPVYSPDGRSIAYCQGGPGDYNFQVYVMNSDGTNRRRVSHNQGRCVSPAWSPDGKQLAFVSVSYTSTSGSRSEIYTVDADGRNMQQITFTGGYNEYPAWVKRR